ncbi:hypothetical protein ScPMuIL_012123 [Solemya velum]
MKTIKSKWEQDEDIKHFIEVVDVPVPQKNEVVVQVKACGLSAINKKILTEVFQKSSCDNFIVGWEVAGIVTKADDSVSHVSVGDEVVGILPVDSPFSGCAEYSLFHEFDVVKKPETLSFEEAAAGIGELVKAYTALFYQGHVCSGDTILVLDGATAFGSIAIQLARMWGAKIITTVSSKEEKNYLESLPFSVAQIIEVSVKNNILVSSVMEETGGVGVDVVLDNGARQFSTEEDIILMSEKYKFPVPHKHDIISCLAVSGKWITSQFGLQLDPPDSQQLFLRGASLCFLFDQVWTLSYAQQGRYQHVLHDAVDKLHGGLVKVKIAKTVSMDEVVEVMKNLDNFRVGKVIMKI